MSLTAEDLINLEKLNKVFATIENEAEEEGLTPDEFLAPMKKYLVGGVANFDAELPVTGMGRANVFAQATSVAANVNTNVTK